MLLAPLSGWIGHAATEGFAPIWWPFGQSLPFVPKNPDLAAMSESLHAVFVWVLLGAVALHVAGALKHHLIDRDGTLRRMLPGRGNETVPPARHSPAPAAAAAAVWVIAIAIGTLQGLPRNGADAGQLPVLEQQASEWTVTRGTLSITVHQFGSDVTGSFADWTASIAFDPEAAPGLAGHATVQIAISSLTLGTVTDQAMGAEFFDASGHPTAAFDADLLKQEDGSYVAEGTLELKGASVPVSLPFSLEMQNGTAHAAGEAVLDRRDFGIGTQSYNDEGSLGFSVRVGIDLEATRSAGS
ncbi:YceI family protein [Mangrovicoccus ximenensis]|uniref:YceI family protein n=1 Tax=Mangrovicoccus ximenensis TaxID=1911570 RepID=UPI001F18EBC3|nr:YceI family protein [Mangrovicoccus ximenensis]